MSFNSWHDIDQQLAKITRSATREQRDLARSLDLTIADDTPRLVAAAMLRSALRDPLHLPDPRPVSARFAFVFNILRQDSDPQIDPTSDDEAEAWVQHLRFMRRHEALKKLEINRGDIVITSSGAHAEISSIGRDGRVYFKGGRGFGAWPDQIELVARSQDIAEAAVEARKQASNTAALRNNSADWSVAKRRELSEFEVGVSLSEADIDSFEDVVTNANDERSVQKFLEDNCHLLTSLLGGTRRYCIPQKRLGGEYIPDFVISDVNSLGVRWVLIELETPCSAIYQKTGKSLDKYARKGVEQIKDWRHWLSDNIAYARQSRTNNGLGLFDIQSEPDGIVIVGRRHLLPASKETRRHDELRSRIQVHTYDWLLESLRGVLSHQGPPAYNRYLLSRA